MAQFNEQLHSTLAGRRIPHGKATGQGTMNTFHEPRIEALMTWAQETTCLYVHVDMSLLRVDRKYAHSLVCQGWTVRKLEAQARKTAALVGVKNAVHHTEKAGKK